MRLSQCTDAQTGLLLPAYELHALDDDDTRRFELHLMECKYCFHQVESFGQWSDLLRTSDNIKATVAAASRESEVARPGKQSLRQLLWPRYPLALRPGLLLAVILLLLLPAGVGLNYFFKSSTGSELREVQTVTLLPTRAPNGAAFHIDSGLDGVINFVVPGDELSGIYEVRIKSESGDELLILHHFKPNAELGMGQLVLPLKAMRPGLYTLTVLNTATDPPSSRDYLFRIVP